MNKIRVIVADDHAVVRMGFVALLKSEPDIQIVGETGNGRDTIELACRTKPDVILMDLMMPVVNGSDATEAIKRRCPDTRILILTTFGDAYDISRALSAGASGALLKSSDYTEVIAAIRKAVSGGQVLSSEVRKMLAESMPPPDLSDRQLEILSSMARGLTNADIARQCGITPDGVKFHITSILAKLGAANRSEAVAIALRRHLLKG